MGRVKGQVIFCARLTNTLSSGGLNVLKRLHHSHQVESDRYMQDQADITRMLHSWRLGDDAARDELFNITYEQLRKIARNLLLTDRQRFVFQPTELVSECALRMFGLEEIDWRDRAHFVAMATTTMRRVVIDAARQKKAVKRDGIEFTLVTAHLGQGQEALDLEELDQALDRLSAISPKMAKVVELKYFGGLTNVEVAEVLGTSESTVKRSWRSARAWLYSELTT